MTRQEYFELAKIAKLKFETKVNETETALKALVNQYERSGMGLVPDHVKALPAYKEAKRAFDNAFNDLRNFNQDYTKTFKEELKAERELKKKIVVQCGSCHGTNPMACGPECM